MSTTLEPVTQNNLGQVTGSNVGSIAAALFSIVMTSQELNQNFNEISMESTQMQNASSKEQRDQIRAEARKNATINFIQAGTSVAKGITDAGVAIGNYANTSSIYKEIGASQDQLKALDTQETQMKNAGPFKGVAESGPSAEEEIPLQAGQSAPRELTDEEVTRNNNIRARKEELLNGNITDGDPALQGYTQEAFEASSDAGENNERQTIQNHVNDQRKLINKDMQSKYSQIQSIENQNNLYKSFTNNALDAFSQAEIGGKTYQAGVHKSQELAYQYDQSTEQTVQQAELKAIDNNLNYMSSAFQALVQAAAQSA